MRRILVLVVLFSEFITGSAQVNLQTGSATFSLPMFDWQDDKSHLNASVALSYNSGNGLRVNDVASNEGQGWNLVAGGVITRMQVGEPDDQIGYNGSGSDQDVTRFPAGYFYSGIAASSGCPSSLTTYPTYGAKNVVYRPHNTDVADRQLDYFSFQFNGKSGQFILDTAGGDHGIMLGISTLRITYVRDPTMAVNYGIRTTITSFTIQDGDGLIYRFTRHGLTKVLTSTFSNGDGTKTAAQPTIKDNSIYCQSAFDNGPTASPWINQNMAYPFIISSWYLSEIDDPMVPSRKIRFTYDSMMLNNNAGTDISYNLGSNRYVVISYKKSVTKTFELDSIIYPDSSVVKFQYGAVSRVDYPGQFPLSSVNITYKGRYLSQYQLNTSYFILNRYGTPITASQKSLARLCLRSVKKIGVDLKEDTPPYLFDYYTCTNPAASNPDDFVPPPFSYAKDVWGYYNGNNSVKSSSPFAPVTLNLTSPYLLKDIPSLKGLCFQNDNVTGTYYNAKPGYAQNGLLKSITYPTGGSLTYQYAQNTGSFIGSASVQNVGGVHVSQTNSLDGGYSNGCATPITTQYNYVVNGTGSASSMWGLETPRNFVVSNNSYREEKQTIHFSLSYPFGTCLWHYVYPGILAQTEAVSMDAIQKIMNILAPVLGVLSVISDVMDVINAVLDGTALEIVAVIIDVISAVLTYILACPRATKLTSATIFYNFDLNSASPLPAQFKRVEITESPGTIGKTVEQFTNGDSTDANMDYPLWDYSSNNTALSVKQRYAPWAYGLPKLITQYDANGNKIKETENDYDLYSLGQITLAEVSAGNCIQKFQPPIYSCRCQVVNNYSKRDDWWIGDGPGTYLTTTPTGTVPDMYVDIYNLYTGKSNLITTYERTYRTADATQFVQTQTVYAYNTGGSCTVPGNYEVNSITTMQSNGDMNYKTIKYAPDYNTGILATMVLNNMVNVPVATTSSFYQHTTGNVFFLSEKVTEFGALANGDAKPSRILEQRFAAPVMTITPYSGPTTTNYSLYKIPQKFTYDANSNLTGLTDEGGRTVTNIYDYNDKYVVASVINADPVADKSAYTSFESQDLSRSGWTLSGSAYYLPSSTAPTGANVFTLQTGSANTLTASSLNTLKAYTLSFWANGSGVNVSGSAVLMKSAPTYGGFTYYEYNIPAGATSVVVKNTSAGAINIDELRLYPATARMRSTTYDPLIGKTSEADENNRIIYYAYDNLGRMRFIEDENRNVVKMYEYNNVSAAKQTGCPATYSNFLLSEKFTRNNCSAGYQGSDVNYIVNKGTYTSSISQMDADFQAEVNILTNGQNYANTNGSCALIYYNVAESQTDTSQCINGSLGGPVIYTVPPNTYSSIISQADANQQALDDVSANAWAYANSPANASCPISTSPDWEWFGGDERTGPDPSYCLSVNGALPPHLFLQATDMNPNSSTYLQKQWEDSGPSSSCPANTYYNPLVTQTFTRNNCTTGYTGTSVPVSVQPGVYSSTVSQAAATQLATNYLNANGQAYANANGSCVIMENVFYNDSRSFQYTVRFTNTVTGNFYSFTANSNSSGTAMQVPSGIYTVYICPVNNYTPNNNYQVGSSYQTNVVCATFNNVTVNASITLYFY